MCVRGRVITVRLKKKWLDRFQINRPMNTYNLVYFALLLQTKKRLLIVTFSLFAFVILQNYLKDLVWLECFVYYRWQCERRMSAYFMDIMRDPNHWNLLWWHTGYVQVVFSSVILMHQPIIEVNTVLTKILYLDSFALTLK